MVNRSHKMDTEIMEKEMAFTTDDYMTLLNLVNAGQYNGSDVPYIYSLQLKLNEKVRKK